MTDVKLIKRSATTLTIEIDFSALFWLATTLFDHCLRNPSDGRTLSLAKEMSHVITESLLNRQIIIKDGDDEKK